MAEEEEFHKLRALLATAACELFAEVDLTAVEVPLRPSSTNTEDYVSTIGFRGERIVGTLAMRLPAKLLAVSHPMRHKGAPPETVDLEDWARELVNRLLGRLKNRCLAVGLDFIGGLPSLVRGTQLELVQLRDVSSQGLSFDCADLPMYVELSYKADAGNPLFVPSQAKASVLHEGHFVVFSSDAGVQGSP